MADDTVSEDLPEHIRIMRSPAEGHWLLTPTKQPPPAIPLLSGDDIIGQSTTYPTAGIYFLILGEQIVYVGRSRSVGSRVGTHRTTGAIRFDRWSFIPCEERAQRALEARYIRKFSPKHNLDRPIAPNEDIPKEMRDFNAVMDLLDKSKERALRARIKAKRKARIDGYAK